MKRILSFLILLTGMTLAAAGERPVALTGYKWDFQELHKEILQPARVDAVQIKGWLPVDKYKDYSAVYIGERLRGLSGNANWNDPAVFKKVLEYVENGGVIIASGNTPQELISFKKNAANFQKLFGFQRPIATLKKSVIKVVNDPYDYPMIVSRVAYKPQPSVKVIATAKNERGEFPIILENKVGKGRFIWIAPCFNRFRIDCRKAGLAMGVPDDRGDYVLTPEGRTNEMLIRIYTGQFLAVPGVKIMPQLEKWDNKPLGSPGDLTYTGKFAKTPEFARAAPVYAPGITVCGKDGEAVIYCPAGNAPLQKLAAELKYHLDKMSGKNFKIVSRLPGKDQTAVIFADAELAAKYGVDTKSFKNDTMCLALKGNHQLITGSNCGVSQALTYLLESIGCRYLWAGAGGKVIPRKQVIVLPALNKCYTTPLEVRNIRELKELSYRRIASLYIFGINPYEHYSRYEKAELDAPGNRNFFQWHGLNDSVKTTGWVQGPEQDYEWGHSFNDFHDRHARKHPEFFALQPDGKRVAITRPRLCHSNSELLDTIAAERIAKFRKYPSKKALSLCLSDGGYSSMCLCENCRKLDPVNAPARGLLVFRPKRQIVPYVEFSDRVVAFSNAIAERVLKVLPDKRFTMYAYSSYSLPPVKVKPHKSLIILSVAGLYVSDRSRASAHRSIASWMSFGNPLLWRPNALQGHRYMVLPQNYARRMFYDVELYKANGMIGTDFDGLEKNWSCKAWIYYALCKAHWNSDRLSYDLYIDDFCKSGFGPAAEYVKAYLDKLEKLGDAAAARNTTLGHSNDYAEVVDEAAIAELNRCLDAAANAAVASPEHFARVRFLQEGMKYAVLNRKLHVAMKNKSRDIRKLQQEFIDQVKAHAGQDPLIVGPTSTGAYNRFIPRDARVKGNLDAEKFIRDNNLMHMLKR